MNLKKITMAGSLAISQLIDYQLELFNRSSNAVDNLKSLVEDNITCEVLEIRLERFQ